MSGKIPVILQMDVKGLGRKGEVVQVTPVYAANVLYPQKKAIAGDKTNLNNRQQGIEKKNNLADQRKQSLLDWKNEIQSNGLTLKAGATPQGKLYAKYDAKSLVKEIESICSISIKSDSLAVDRIEHTGDFVVKFHEGDIKFSFDLHVVAK